MATTILNPVLTLADLKLVFGATTGDTIEMLGYHSEGDGGGGIFYWEDANISDNLYSMIVVDNGNNGRWVRLYSDGVNVKWFGAKGDGIADDQNAITAAIAYVKAKRVQMLPPYFHSSPKSEVKSVVYIPDGHYLTESGDIYIPPYLTVEGSSREGVIVQCKDAAKHVFRFEPGVSEGFDDWNYTFTRLKNLTIAGKHFGTNPNAWHFDLENRLGGCGIYILNRIKVQLENVRCSGFEDAGIRTENSYYLPMTGVQCDTNLVGLVARESTTTIHCSKSEFSHNSIGVVLDNSFSNHFETCTIESNTGNFLPYPLDGDENITEVRSGQGIVIRASYNNSFKSCYIEDNIVNVTLANGARSNTFEDNLFCPAVYYNLPTYITPVFLSFYGTGNIGNRFIQNYHVDSFANTNKGRNIEIRTDDYGSDTEIATCSKSDYDEFKAVNAAGWAIRLSGYEFNAPRIHNPSTGHSFMSVIERENTFLRTTGSTSQRPSSTPIGGLPVGFVYFDTDLLMPIYWSSSGWRDANGIIV